ncbi:carbohydrate kinase family protein [Microterricola viridarii]|uniref:Carbohydrate kinase PfkB domain-containing protein n=1 Tax=Microterricola viridarii TaxID=412690 RepID=A0A109QYE2_9MICO|nr:carbohydrate kinase family protein [Microterricola viridarii]AMB58305.1 hypothetical protein AWU67_04925 [Microterricola viridarii]
MTRAGTVFVGDVALDEYFTAESWPALGDKAWLDPLPAVVGGMIANAASVHAALGAPTRFLTTMNDGAISQRLLSDLETGGVDTGLCLVDNELADSRCLIFLSGGQHVVLTPRIGDQRFELDAERFQVLSAARSLYSSIGDLRRLRHGALTPLEILRALRASGTRIVLDLDVADLEPGDLELIGTVDLLFVNRIGFDRLRAGRSASDCAGALIAGGLSHLVVTRDADGCIVYSAGAPTATPISVAGIAADVVDVTGAGDAFCSAFLFALDRTADAGLAALFANGAGARATEAHGARSGVAGVGDVIRYLEVAGVDTAALNLALTTAPSATSTPDSH